MWAFLPLDPSRLPDPLAVLVPTLTYGPFLLALAVVTALSFVPPAVYGQERTQGAALYALLALASALLLNVAWHIGWALAFEGYVPGLVTALFVQLPAASYVLCCAWRDRWLRRRVLWSLPLAAAVLHGPVLFGLLAGARWVFSLRG